MSITCGSNELRIRVCSQKFIRIGSHREIERTINIVICTNERDRRCGATSWEMGQLLLVKVHNLKTKVGQRTT